MSKSIYKTFSSYKSNILKDKRSKKLIFQQDGRNHYVYRITNLVSSKHYYGSRCTKLEPIDDLGIKYFSSSSVKQFLTEQKEHPENFKYKIIKIFNNPGDQCLYESYLHQYFQVNSNNIFINLSNCLPFGFSISSNLEIFEKMVKTRNIIDENTGLTSFQSGSKKGNITKDKIILDIGKTIRELAITKMVKTNQIINQNTGNTTARDNALKAAESMTKIDKTSGLTYKQLACNKAKMTMNKIDSSGLNGYERHRNKQLSLNSYKTGALKRKGKNNVMFKGYYITPLGKYETIKEAMNPLNMTSAMTILNLCKNNKIISRRAYLKSPYLYFLGSEHDIVGKTSTEIGFYFEYTK